MLSVASRSVTSASQSLSTAMLAQFSSAPGNTSAAASLQSSLVATPAQATLVVEPKVSASPSRYITAASSQSVLSRVAPATGVHERIAAPAPKPSWSPSTKNESTSADSASIAASPLQLLSTPSLAQSSAAPGYTSAAASSQSVDERTPAHATLVVEPKLSASPSR